MSQPSHFKSALQALEGCAPDESAATLVASAYAAGKVQGWLAAALLGGIRHAEGYNTARQILLAHPGSLAESYAGPAMARIAGTESRDDLLEILFVAPHIKTREGAAFWLAEIPYPELMHDLGKAAVERRITMATAASLIADLDFDESLHLQWMNTSLVLEKLVIRSMELRIARSPNTPRGTIAGELRERLGRDLVPMARSSRALLLAWAEAE